MSAVFSKEGSRALRGAWILLTLAVLAGASLGYASWWYLGKMKADTVASTKRLQEARARTSAVKRELEDLRASSKVFQGLLDRGVLQEERRLDFIERLDQLKTSHRLAALEYDVEPQRVLPLADGRTFNSLDVMGSRVKIRFKALHEGDALAFLEDLSVPQRGFNAMSRCHLLRIERAGADLTSPRIEGNCALEWISLKDKGKARAS